MVTPFKSQPDHPWAKEEPGELHFDFREWTSAKSGEGCETATEAAARNEKWIPTLLAGDQRATELSRLYRGCCDEDPCGVSMEPMCTRRVRVNLVSRAASAIQEKYQEDVDCYLVTLVKEQWQRAPGALSTLSLSAMSTTLRQELISTDLKEATAVGGPDFSFNQHSNGEWEDHWQGHMQIVVAGASKEDISRALTPFYPSTETISRPIVVTEVYDLQGALSYCQKALFFRRVSYRDLKGKQRTRPPLFLRPKQFREIAVFMATSTISSRIFLRGLRRRGRFLTRA